MSGENGREHDGVIVSERAYKAASAFTTVFCVALIFVGFLFIDKAIGWPARKQPDPVLTVIGIAFMLSAAGLYIFSLRFKTEQQQEQQE
ncbi:MAG: hypothetical protein SXQ77_03980 [Halobacteria archaeon]|nr:hypothetical protein [Halobacteria archaeon]